MTERKITTEKTLAYLSLALTILILLSIVFNILYYQRYNIEITNYMDISESVALFIPYFENILLNAFPKVIGLYIGFFVLPKYFRKLYLKKEQFEKIYDPNYVEPWVSIIVGTLGTYFSAAAINYYFISKGQFWSYEPALIAISVFLIYIYQRFRNKVSWKLYFPGVTIVFIVYLSFYFFQILNGKAVNEGTEMVIEKIILKDPDRIIQSDSTIKFIDKTKDFVFIFNSKTKVTTVIPKEEIKQIEINGKSN